jgi:hypothetical protein
VSMSRNFSRPAVLVNVVLASVVSFPHDIEVVRQAALLRAKLIGGERAAGHLRVVQASFAKEIAEFIRSRYTGVPDVELKAEVAGAVLAATLVAAVEFWGRGGCKGRSSQTACTRCGRLFQGWANHPPFCHSGLP